MTDTTENPQPSADLLKAADAILATARSEKKVGWLMSYLATAYADVKAAEEQERIEAERITAQQLADETERQRKADHQREIDEAVARALLVHAGTAAANSVG